jgi:hypothetical protein
LRRKVNKIWKTDKFFTGKEQFAREKRAPLKRPLACILVICILLVIESLIEGALALIALVLFDEVL